MDKIDYEHENGCNYLVVPTEDMNVDSYELKMLTKNKISPLLDVSLKNINNKTYFYYNITSKRQLTKLYELRKIQWKDVETICRSIEQTAAIISDYMLGIDSVLFLPEYMYIDMGKNEINYVYFPDNSYSCTEMLKELFEYVLEHYEHGKEKDNLIKVYGIYQKVLDENYSICHFSSLIQEEPIKEKDSNNGIIIEEIPKEEIISEEEQPVKAYRINTVKLMAAIIILLMITAVIALFFPEKSLVSMSVPICIVILLAGSAALVQIIKYKKRLENAGMVMETVGRKAYTLEDMKCCEEEESSHYSENKTEKNLIMEKEPEKEVGNTVLLSDFLNQKKLPLELKFIYQHTDRLSICAEDIIICEFPCVIGSLSEYCNIVIQNELISRMHICIYREENEYYIEDMNSTNGTFLNDRQILPQQRYSLKNGDVLRLANIVYKVEKS